MAELVNLLIIGITTHNISHNTIGEWAHSSKGESSLWLVSCYIAHIVPQIDIGGYDFPLQRDS